MLRRLFSRESEAARRLADDIELLHNSPLVDPVWYRETYADLRDTPVDVARHYLEHGAREGRNPGPGFDTRFYLKQNPDVAATGMNPLVHYLLHGQREGRLARPSETNGSHEVSSVVSSAQASQISEPGIKPPPLAPVGHLSATEVCRRNAQIVAAIRTLKERNGLTGGQSQFADLCAAKMSLVGTGEWLSSAQISSAFAEISQNGEEATWADVVVGLGVTPDSFLKEDDLPRYPVPILQRYNERRIEITRRFELDHSKAGTVKDGPKISLLVPVYKTPIVFLERAILSVVFQTYTSWELILVDDYSQRSDVKAVLRFYESVDPRIKVLFRSTNGGISAASNDALALARGEFVGLLDHDDMLTRDALEKVGALLAEKRDLDFVYTDECKIDRDDIADDLFYKPDWSPLLLLNFMYTGHFSVYRKSLVQSVGGFRSKYDFSQDYDLALRIAEREPNVAHIDEILYGWRMAAGSAAVGDKPTARISNIAALQDAADRRGYDGIAIPLPTANRVKRRIKAPGPLVSIVIPSDSYANIRDSVNSIEAHSSYKNHEIIVVTNSELIGTYGDTLVSPTTRFVNYDKPFNFSDKCNAGAAQARGDYVIFFNDDVRVISADWIETLLEYLTLPDVGVVGPKMIYENGSIQHAGMVTGVRRLVGTAFHAYPGETTAYFNLAQSVRETSLISAACLAMPTPVFRDIGGFDARNVPIAHSDIDLCFRVRESGRSCVYTPHAQLMHIGHSSIGAVEAAERQKAKPFRKDKADLYLLKQWGRYLERDPYFPPKMRDLVYIDSQEPFSYRKSIPAKTTKGAKDFILFSHDLSRSGAPRVFCSMAKVLIAKGYYVMVVSPEDGAFAKHLSDAGGDIIIDPLALTGHSDTIDLAKNFDVAICNTIVCWQIPRRLQLHLPVYLWAHENLLIRHYVENVQGFCEGISAAAGIWADGPMVAAAIREQCGLEAQIIEGCVEEFANVASEGLYGRAIVIALIGTYEPRKGQDLAILGFSALSPEIRAKCKLVMSGRTLDHQFRNELNRLANARTHVDLLEELLPFEVAALASRADIILVPSRDDALPLVSMDALASGKILVCSKTTGTSAYIVDGESGFILHRNSPEDICATLDRVLNQSSDWPRIRANARRVYEAHFTPRLLEQRVFRALDRPPSSPLAQISN